MKSHAHAFPAFSSLLGEATVYSLPFRSHFRLVLRSHGFKKSSLQSIPFIDYQSVFNLLFNLVKPGLQAKLYSSFSQFLSDVFSLEKYSFL